MSEQKYDVACLGLTVADVLVKPVDDFPGPGGITMLDTLEVRTGRQRPKILLLHARN